LFPLDIFTLSAAVFHRLFPCLIQFLGRLVFRLKISKYLKKNHGFFASKHHRIDRFPPNMILVQSRKIYESIEQTMLFLLVLVSAMLIIEIMNEFYIILKNTKKLQL